MTGLSVIPIGERTLKLKKTDEVFTMKFPQVDLKNLVFGSETYMYYRGNMEIANLKTGDTMNIVFPGLGWTGKKDFKCSGTMKNKNDEVLFLFKGKWTEYGTVYDKKTEEILLHGFCENLPKNTEDYYCFTEQSFNLNNLTEDLLRNLPPTDCRLRPDLRAYENGDIPLAAKEKIRLEDN